MSYLRDIEANFYHYYYHYDYQYYSNTFATWTPASPTTWRRRLSAFTNSGQPVGYASRRNTYTLRSSTRTAGDNHRRPSRTTRRSPVGVGGVTVSYTNGGSLTATRPQRLTAP